MNSSVSKLKPQPLLIAAILIIVGLIGLSLAIVPKKKTAPTAKAETLRVITTQTQQAVQSQSSAATQLQGAAGVKNFNSGKDAAAVQSGADIDTLLKNQTIQ